MRRNPHIGPNDSLGFNSSGGDRARTHLFFGACRVHFLRLDGRYLGELLCLIIRPILLPNMFFEGEAKKNVVQIIVTIPCATPDVNGKVIDAAGLTVAWA